MLLHQCAIDLGCTLAELGERMTGSEWTRWKAYYRLRPSGEAAADLRIGVLAAAVVGAITKKALAPIKFMPILRRLDKLTEATKSDKRRRAEKIEAKKASVMEIAAKFGAKKWQK